MTAHQLIREAIPATAAERFTGLMWDAIRGQQVPTQPHGQSLLRRNAIEVHGRNHPPLLALHWGLTRLVSDRVGCALLPSFIYFRIYFADDICRVHADRPACEVSLSLTLGSSDHRPWPLDLGTAPVDDHRGIDEDFGDEPYASVAMGPGDGLLYEGSRIRHGRVTPNPNQWSAHAFCMWVRDGGAHAAEAYERL